MTLNESVELVEKRLREYRAKGVFETYADNFSDIPEYMKALGQVAVYGEIEWDGDNIIGKKIIIARSET